MSPKQCRCARRQRFIVNAAAVLVLIFSSGSGADQSDPNLIELFARLQDETNPAIARRVEREIWSIWHETPDEKSLEIMRSARSALARNDFDSAIDALNQLVDYVPNFAEAWNQRAIVLYMAEDYAGSLRDIRQALTLEPRHFGALSGRGQVYMRLEEPKLALKAFESALHLNPWMANIRGQMNMLRAYLNARPAPI